MFDIFAKIQETFCNTFDIEPDLVTIDTSPNDIPQWDSLGHMTLITSLGSAFGVSFDLDDVMAMENVREILRIVESKR